MTLLAVPKSTREIVAPGSAALGVISSVLFIVLLLGEIQGPHGDPEKALPKFLENIGLGINQSLTPVLRLLDPEKHPRVAGVLTIVDILGLMTTVMTNEIRGAAAYNKEAFKPM